MKPLFPPCFGFYAILTDPLRGYEYCTELLVKREVTFIQLRMKNQPPKRVEAVARTLRAITRGSRSLFIVNDDPQIAAAVEADGVHVGQGDLPCAQVRAMVGPDMLIGISTHTPAQTAAACALCPDYIGVGPLFPTPTKAVADPAIGIDGMQAMLGCATVPAVVLGSITAANLPQILQAGACNFSLVRPFNQSSNPAAVLDEILAICNIHG